MFLLMGPPSCIMTMKDRTGVPIEKYQGSGMHKRRRVVESDSSEDEQPQRFKKPDPVAELEALGLSRTQAERALLAAAHAPRYVTVASHPPRKGRAESARAAGTV